ncbi:baseplate J/gp47 family protein [Bradyrhizobium sp. Tv2a-2]|uniref:baseplate J/gp47 family protein n=1 Tax=Bradyrhizobium sp. Tv2a-2 TaxID=113395 RepID=UPI00041E2489|nr:baseplate J/gp47 family protein [Bradyrhizobium sp. Tv2a-2]
MASLPTKSEPTIVSEGVAGIQGRASKLINFATGSTLRAIVEGFAGVFLWMQGLVLLVLQASRLSTAEGDDVDTFTVDFMKPLPGSQTATLPGGSPRLGAQAASGQVTFARFTAAPSSCFIPAAGGVTTTGAITNAGPNNAATVLTNDGTNQTFVVTVDTANPYYSATLGGYTLPANQASFNVPVEALIAGSAGNVQAGTISLISSPITGIDTVNNVASFTNGADQESDSQLKRRFSAYILGLARGDHYGLNASIEGTDVTVQYALTELYNYDGSYHPAYFFVVADDGSGSPSPAFMQMITDAANAVRPLGIQCAVFPTVLFTANVQMQITTLQGYNHDVVVAQVSNAVATNINLLGLGKALSIGQISAWAYAVPGVVPGNGVAGVTLNGAIGDAATIVPSKLTQDGKNTIIYGSVKAGVMVIS